MKKIVAPANFFRKIFEMNVAIVYFSKACALNSFSLDDFYTVTFITFLLYLYANNLINYFSNKHIQVCDGNDILCSDLQKKKS